MESSEEGEREQGPFSLFPEKTAAATIKPGSHLWFTGICCRSEIKLRALLPSFYLILTTAHSCKYSYYCNIKRSWYWRKKCLSHCPRWQIASRRARITTQINPTARLVHINVALYCPQLESYHLYDFSRPARLKINTSTVLWHTCHFAEIN